MANARDIINNLQTYQRQAVMEFNRSNNVKQRWIAGFGGFIVGVLVTSFTPLGPLAAAGAALGVALLLGLFDAWLGKFLSKKS